MSGNANTEKRQAQTPDNWSVKTLDEEARRNLISFFALLLKVDKRNNPHLYASNRSSNNAY